MIIKMTELTYNLNEGETQSVNVSLAGRDTEANSINTRVVVTQADLTTASFESFDDVTKNEYEVLARAKLNSWFAGA